MRRGVIGIPADEGTITSVEDDDYSYEDEFGNERYAALRTETVQTLDGETDHVLGEAFRERSAEVWDRYIDDSGAMKKRRRIDKRTDYTEFVAVPASPSHPGFVVVGSSEGTFAFDVLSKQVPTRVVRASLSLRAFLDDREAFRIKSAGGPRPTPSNGSGSESGSESAGKVMVWGGDEDMDDLVDLDLDADTTEDLTPLSGEYRRYGDRDEGRLYYVNLSSGGYVEVYDPDHDTGGFLDWVESDILPYATGSTTD